MNTETTNVQLLAEKISSLENVVNSINIALESLSNTQNQLSEKINTADEYLNETTIENIVWMKETMPSLRVNLEMATALLQTEGKINSLLSNNSRTIRKNGKILDDVINDATTSKSCMNINSYFVSKYMCPDIIGKVEKTFQQLHKTPYIMKKLEESDFATKKKTGKPSEDLRKEATAVYTIYKNSDFEKDIELYPELKKSIEYTQRLYKIFRSKHEIYKREFEEDKQEQKNVQI